MLSASSSRNAETNKDWRALYTALLESLAPKIEDPYFKVARLDAPSAYRERAYCYELYHQLRSLLPPQPEFSYTLHGEIDKRGHKAISKHFAKPPNPDFVIHGPGGQGGLAVIEVKPSSFRISDAQRDLEKLRTFIDKVHYSFGVFLVFGPGGKEPMPSRIGKLSIDGTHDADKRLVVIWQQSR